MKFHPLLFSFLAVCSCLRPVAAVKILPEDSPFTASIVLATMENYRTLKYRDTFVAVYEKNGKELCFVAVQHSSDPGSLTFRTIRRMFETFSPGLVMVEYHTNEEGISPSAVAGEMKAKTVFSGEPEYAMHLAALNPKWVDFLPAEPPTRFIVERMGGFSVQGRPIRGKDVLFFYLLRGMPGMVRQTAIKSDDDLEHFFPGSVRGTIRYYDFDEELAGVTVRDFAQWYEGLTGRRFDFRNIPKNTPVGHDNLSRINKYLSYLRDVSILNHVTKAITSYDKILVVYGCGHYCRLKPAFERLFGPVKREFQIGP